MVGEVYKVECAVDANGASPARQFLDGLRDGMWADDPNDDKRPSDEQIYDYPRLLAVMKSFASTGEPPGAQTVNTLQDGVWEFKFNDKRASFFDTPGDGTFSPKHQLRDRAGSPYPDSDWWWVPDFDDWLRLGHCFGKVGEQAGDGNVLETLRIRREDLGHDQAS